MNKSIVRVNHFFDLLTTVDYRVKIRVTELVNPVNAVTVRVVSALRSTSLCVGSGTGA